MKLLVLCALACATSFADTKKADEIAPADVKKFLVFLDKLVDAVVADKDSCPKMATDINKMVDANLPLLKRAKAAQDKGKKLPQSAQDHVDDSSRKLLGGMVKCQNDKAVAAAFDRMTMKQK